MRRKLKKLLKMLGKLLREPKMIWRIAKEMVAVVVMVV